MSLGRLSPQEREFQFKLMFVVVFVLLVLGGSALWVAEAKYAFFGETARAWVVEVDHNACNANGARLRYPRIDYQYVDNEAKVVRDGSYFKFSPPVPAPGDTFTVQYLPNRDHSSIVSDEFPSLKFFWLTIPAIAMFLVLAGMCVLPARADKRSLSSGVL